jgi:hypothetical protein
MADAFRNGRSPGVPVCAALLASAALLPAAAMAQPAPRPQPVVTGDPLRQDLRAEANVPNISGTWVGQQGNRTIQPMDGGPTPFLPWAQAFFENRAAAEAAGQPLFDPSANCLPSGVPRIIANGYPIDILQVPGMVVITQETLHGFRTIHLDGKPKPADLPPSYLGYSAGHWDGDVLVVETTGLNGFTQVDEEGRPKSSDMRVVERYQKRGPDLLQVTFTLYDPRTYSRPWSWQGTYKWSPEMRQNEYICEENNRNKPDVTGKLRHGTEKK